MRTRISTLFLGCFLACGVENSSEYIFKNGELGYGSYRMPALTATTNSTLLAFAEAREHGSDQDHIDLVMKRSIDNGKSWGALIVVAGSKDKQIRVAHGQPTPVYDAQAGKVILVWCLNNSFVFVTTSSDEGLTWSASRNITDMVKRPGWGWMATGPNHALQLKMGAKQGRLIVPFNTFFADSDVVVHTRQTACAQTRECAVYYNDDQKTLATDISITNPADPSMLPLRFTMNGTIEVPPFIWAGDRSGIFYSDDHGETWQLGGMIDTRLGSSECVAEEIIDGVLLSFRIEDADTGCRKMAISHDFGLTFEHFFEPKACIPEPRCQQSMLKLGDGRLVHFGPGSSVARSNMTLFVSKGSGSQDQLSFNTGMLFAKGAGGYSDIVELASEQEGNASRVSDTTVGLAYENGGIVWGVASIPIFVHESVSDSSVLVM